MTKTMKKTLRFVAAAAACSIALVPGLAQENENVGDEGIGNEDIGTAPNFIPLQDDMALEEGEEVYVYWCWNCHGEGPGKPGTTALDAIHEGEVPAVLHERTDLNPDYIENLVRNGVSIMPHFRKTQISDDQLDSLVEYLTRNNDE